MKLITAALILEPDLKRRLMLALEMTAAERHGCARGEVLPAYVGMIESILHDKFLTRGKLDFCLGVRSFRTLRIGRLPHIRDHSDFFCSDYSSVFSIGGSPTSPSILSVVCGDVVYLYPDEAMILAYSTSLDE